MGPQSKQDEINKRCAQLLQEVEDSQKLIDLYKQRVDQCKGEVAALNEAVIAGAGERTALLAQIENYKKIISEYTTLIDREDKRNTDARAEIDALRKEVAGLRSGRLKTLAFVAVIAGLIGWGLHGQ